MAVAFDAASESHTGTTGSAGEASFTWNHGGASSGVKGVVVFVFNLSGATDIVTGVTYGGVAMSAVTGGLAADTVTEPGNCKAYFLGASIPQGTQAIVVSRVNNAALLYAAAGTVTASADTDYTGVLIEEENQALAEENIDDGSPGTNSVRFAGTYSGAANITSALVPGANSTLLGGFDPAGNCAMAVVETTPGQGARPVGFVAATDDVAAVYLAVKETSSGTNHTATPTDPEGLVDSAAQVTDSARPFTDPLGLLDAASGVTDSVRDQTDPLGLLDDVSYQVSSGTEQTFTDPLGLTDSLVQVADQLREVTDPAGLTDSIAQAQDYVYEITDALGLVDDGTWLAIGADAVGILDSTTVVQSHDRTVTDPLGLLDGASYNLSSGGIDHTATITDSLGLSDVTVTVTDSVRTQTDTLGLTDSIIFGLVQPVTVTDGLGLLDSVTYIITVEVAVTDGLGLTDTATTTADYAQTITDPLGLTDSVSSAATGATFWTLNPVAFTANPSPYVPVEAGDTPPSW